jgi:hypothetical protein
MTHPSTPRHAALATLVLVTITAAACGHPSPAAPDAAASSKDAAPAAPSALAAAKKPGSPGGSTAMFPLEAGTFTIANRKGASISGVYSGETNEGGGVSVTTLRLEVQKGTGNFAGASGVLEGKGTGAFTGEGGFALDVAGTLATDGKKRSKFNATLHGDSRIGCDAGRIVITLHADGPDGVRSAGDMRHEVANAGCGS